MTTKYDKYSDGDYQEKVGKFVNREVYYCVSSLISHLASGDGFYDEFMHLLESAPDANDFEEAFEYSDVDESERAEILKEEEPESLDDWYNIFSECNLDYPDPGEIYEHWIVSDWFADKLADKGEAIEKDLHGLTIWGRACTGQSILLDSVICDIYDDVQKAIS